MAKARARCRFCGKLFGKGEDAQVYCSHSCAASFRHSGMVPTTSLQDADVVNKNNLKYRQDERGQWWYYGAKQRTRAHVKPCAECGRKFVWSVFHRNETCSRQCGTKAFYRKHPDRFKGDNSRRWKGGRQVRNGYVFIHKPDHPSCQGNKRAYVAEHRLVMEGLLGRYLAPTEQVHHKNGLRDDNRPENLELWAISQPPGQRVEEQQHCPTCTCFKHGQR